MYRVYSRLDRIEKKLGIENAYRGSPDARFTQSYTGKKKSDVTLSVCHLGETRWSAQC